MAEFLSTSSTGIAYSFRRSTRARHLRVQINPDGSVAVVAPASASFHLVDRFVAHHLVWIKKHVAKAQKKHDAAPRHDYRTGDSFLFLGERHDLTVLEADRKKPKVEWNDAALVVSIPAELAPVEKAALVQEALTRFFKKKAGEVIHDRLSHFNDFYHFEYRRVTLRDQKTRWGSCSRDGNLNFNWRLILAPIEVIDYVVVHELCHLREMNHSTRFWALVVQTLPDYKQWRKWIRDHHAWLKA
ncbi:M48 family metallopeptidase [Candidatus Peregrinibacteria bacterium]|nr:M48 family metallopeptidase [Candidatus Peregrinibacteria bacterium]